MWQLSERDCGLPSVAWWQQRQALLRCCAATEGILRKGLRAKDGGGGSRTRVREYAVAALYMLSRPCMFATAVKERRKPAAASSDSSRRHASEQHVATSLLI